MDFTLFCKYLFSVTQLLLLAKELNAFENERIIGAYEVQPGEYPSMVRIVISASPIEKICTGTIIDNRHVITSAHCVWNQKSGKLFDKNQVKISSGIISECELHCADVHDIENIIVHESFPGSDFWSVAILKTTKEIIFDCSDTSNIQIIDKNIDHGQQCVFVGWSPFVEDGLDKLLAGQLQMYIAHCPIFSRVDREAEVQYVYMEDRTVCGIDHYGALIGVCGGGLGDALICGGKLAGIVRKPPEKKNITCGFATFFVYFRQSKMAQWLKDNIK